MEERKYQFESRKHGFTKFSDFPKIDISKLKNVTNTGFTKFGDRFANVTIGKDLTDPKYKDLNVPMYKDLSFFPVLQDGNCALSAIMCQMAEYSHLNFHEKIDFESMKLNPSKKNKDVLKKEQSKKEIQFGIRSIMCDIYKFILDNCKLKLNINRYRGYLIDNLKYTEKRVNEEIQNIQTNANLMNALFAAEEDLFDDINIDELNEIETKSSYSQMKMRYNKKDLKKYIKYLYNNINSIIGASIMEAEKSKKTLSENDAFLKYEKEMLNEEGPLYLNEVDILLLSLIFNCPISIFFYEKVDEDILFIEEKLFKPPKEIKEEEEKKKEESKIIRIGIKTRNYNGTSITQSHYDAILVRPKEYTDTFHGKIKQIPRSDDALLHAICRAYETYKPPYFHIANDFKEVMKEYFKEVMKEYLKSDDSKGITIGRYFISNDALEKIKEDIENDIHVYGTYGEFEYEILAEFLKTKQCNISFYKASNFLYKNDFSFNKKYPMIHILHFDDAITTNKLETIPDAGPPSIQSDFAVIYPIEKIPNELEMQKQEIIRTGTNDMSNTGTNDMSRKIIGKRANEIAANTGGPNNLNFSNIIDSRQIMMNRFGERRERLDEINKEFLKTKISDKKRNSLEKEKKYLEKLPIEEETKKDVEELQNYIYKGRLNETEIYYPATERKPEKNMKELNKKEIYPRESPRAPEKKWLRLSNNTRKMLKNLKGNIKRKMTQKMTRKRPFFRRLFGPS